MRDPGPDDDDVIEDLFDEAASYVERVALSREAEQLPDKVLLDLYGLFKQATVGPCASQTTPRPSFFDPRGRAKYDAWFKLGDLSPRRARQRYSDTLTACLPGWRDRPTSTSSKSVVGPVFSMLKNTADVMDEDFPRIIKLVQDGDTVGVEDLLHNDPEAIHHTDSEGCTCLHWAADKGNKELIMLLLTRGADKYATDVDGLTPLEYAKMHSEEDGAQRFFIDTLS